MISLDRLCDFYVGMFTLCFFVSIFPTLSSVLVLSSWFGVYEATAIVTIFVARIGCEAKAHHEPGIEGQC